MMRTWKAIKIGLLVAFLSSLGYSQAPTWRDLKLLVSTEEDVMALGGEEVKPKWGSHRQFNLSSELQLDIKFEQAGFCSDPDGKWNVPKSTIVDLTVNFLRPLPISELGLDVTEFTQHRLRNDIPSIYYLEDGSNGVVLEVREERISRTVLVQRLRRSPPKSQDHLRCGDQRDARSDS